jgi:hypothetical protein
MYKKQIHRWVAIIMAAGACAGVAEAQSSDALLNKLVQNGLITQQVRMN